MKISLYIWVNSCYDGQAGQKARRNHYARCSVVGESCKKYTTRPLLGFEEKFFERWKFPMIQKDKKTQVILDNATHEGDTGSPEVQVAILTARIN